MVTAVVRLFYREFRGLHQAAYVLALFAFGSQLLALVRDRALAHTFGASPELDLYYLAFRIPDILFVVFAAMLSVYVLIPFVSKLQAEKSDAEAADFLSQIFTFFLLAYICIAALLFATASLYIPVLFSDLNPTDQATLVTLLRVLLLQPLLLGCSSLMGVITQLRQRFVVYAISPILYNVGIIIGLFVLYPLFGLVGLVYGVVFGALLHAIVQVPLVLSSKLKFSLALPKISTLRNIISIALPRAVTLSLNQVVLLTLSIIAASMTIGSVSVFQFAFNLQSVPLAIIGVSYSVAAFPVLARLLASQEFEKFKTHLKTALRHIIFWSVPTIVLVIILRAHMVRIILGSGNFSWDDTRLTAAILAIFSISLLAQAINLLTIRAFYAYGDTRTPLYVALFSSTISIAVAVYSYYILYAIPAFQHTIESWFRLLNVPGTEVITLALGFSAGVITQSILMMYLLNKSFPKIFAGIGASVRQAVVAAALGGIVTYLTLNFVVKGINQETFMGILLQGGVAAACGLMTIYAAYRLQNSPELHEIQSSIHRRFRKEKFTSIK